MKLIAKLIMLSISIVALLLLATLNQILENTPILHDKAEMTAAQITHGKQVFQQNDPRRLRPGSIASVSLAQEDLDLAINYFTNQYLGGVAGLQIDKNRADIESTFNLPGNPFGRYLNLTIVLRQTGQLPQIDHMNLGKLWIPGFPADFIIEKCLPLLTQSLPDWQTIAAMIREVKFEQRRMIVSYRWQNDLPAKFSDALFTIQDHQQIETYQQRLAAITKNSKSSLNLTELLMPIFQLANERSNQGNAIAENRDALLVLTFYVNHIDLGKIIPQSKNWPHPIWRTVTLNNRGDFPKHYLVSAMLAAYAGTPFADAAGVFKEIEDLHGGSGFSFNDIAADRAGTLIGEQAISSEPIAKKIQKFMATAKESDIFPFTSDLPEFMPEAEFLQRFGGTQGEAYKRMMAEIERRVAELAINK